jgi:hypothetical protein
MKEHLSFWVQSLDNKSPDIIIKGGTHLCDDKSRQELISEIYRIPKNNKTKIKLHPSPAITLYSSRQKFVIEAVPSEKDQSNRLAPIIIYGVLPNVLPETWAKDVHVVIKAAVSDDLKRTLDDDAFNDIETLLNELKKKWNPHNIRLNFIRSLIELINSVKQLLRKLALWARKLFIWARNLFKA